MPNFPDGGPALAPQHGPALGVAARREQQSTGLQGLVAQVQQLGSGVGQLQAVQQQQLQALVAAAAEGHAQVGPDPCWLCAVAAGPQQGSGAQRDLRSLIHAL